MLPYVRLFIYVFRVFTPIIQTVYIGAFTYFVTCITGYDLFACEAKYHKVCKSSHVNCLYDRSENSENINEQTQSSQRTIAHKATYESAVHYIIVNNREVCKLTDFQRCVH